MIELKSISEGFLFQCGVCNQFPEIGFECKLCNHMYCHTCVKSIHSMEIRCCVAKLKTFEIMEPFQQYVYSRLTIKCLTCKQVLPLNKIQKHQIKCQLQLSKLSLLKDKTHVNVNLLQKIPIQKKCLKNKEITGLKNQKQLCTLNCKKCRLFEYFQNEQNLSEDTIIQLQQIQFECKICHQEGNLFIMRQHHLSCQEEIVSCICGLQEKRGLIKNHIPKCLSDQINNYLNQKLQISQRINLQQIAFIQQIVQSRHVNNIIGQSIFFQSSDQDYETWGLKIKN